MRWVSVLTLIGSLLLPRAVLAQADVGRITGIVTDSATSQPLPSVTVRVLETATPLGAVTNAEGRYTILNVPAGTRAVRVQRIGYAPQERTVIVTAGEAATLDVMLRQQTIELEQVVSVGYGEQERRNITGSVATVTTDALDEGTPIVSVDQLLQGTVPGVTVNTSSSEPGGAISVRIRGSSSITGNSEPLYVIDGFPIENDDASSTGTGGRDRTTGANPLSAINPNDIERIEILKDASSTAIYGARGANGVVLITTKQGRGSKPTVSFDFYTGVQSVTKQMDLLGPQEYMDYANAYILAGDPAALIPFPDSVRARYTASTDWQDEIFRRAPVRSLQTTVRGATAGDNTTRYSMSAGIFDQDGIVVGSGLRRYSGRLNVIQQIGSRLEVAGTFTANRAQSKSVPTNGQQNRGAGAVSAAIQYAPILPVRRPDGSYSLLRQDIPLSLDPPETPNPVSMAVDVLDSLSDTRLLGTLYGDYTILDGLRFRSSFGADYASRWRYTYYPRTTLRGMDVGGDAIRNSASTTSWLNENTLSYQREVAEIHNFNFLAGYTRQKQEVDGERLNAQQFVSDITGYRDIDAGTVYDAPESRFSGWTMASYLGRVNYALMDRYLFTVTGRRDGSSRFPEGNKWGFFPSAAFAWRASAEPFMANVPNLDELKLRLSYGVVGNPAIRPYQSLARLNTQGYSFGGSVVPGFYVTSIENPALKWERTAEVNVGVDLAVWDRALITVDRYKKKTTDLLLQVELPGESGFESALQNVGSVENKGLEVGLDLRLFEPNRVGGFSWRSNISYARNRNKVLDLGDVTEIQAQTPTEDYDFPGTLIRVGQPIGVFYGFRSGGVIRDSAQLAEITWTNFSGNPFDEGDMLILDIASDTGGPDGVITDADRTIIGDPTPDFTYGLTNTFGFRGFEVSALIQGVHGNEIMNVNRIRSEGSPRSNVLRARWLDRWTPETRDAKYPRIRQNPNQPNPNNITDNLLEDGSYLRLRTLTFSYTLPDRLVRERGFGSARIYVTGTNLFTRTDYSGFNPDVSSQGGGSQNRGIDIGAYPLAKTWTIGTSITH